MHSIYLRLASIYLQDGEVPACFWPSGVFCPFRFYRMMTLWSPNWFHVLSQRLLKNGLLLQVHVDENIVHRQSSCPCSFYLDISNLYLAVKYYSFGLDDSDFCPAVRSCSFGLDVSDFCQAVRYCSFGLDVSDFCPAVRYCSFGLDVSDFCPAVRYCSFGLDVSDFCQAVRYCSFGLDVSDDCPAVRYCSFGLDISDDCLAVKYYSFGLDDSDFCQAVRYCSFGLDVSDFWPAVKYYSFGLDDWLLPGSEVLQFWPRWLWLVPDMEVPTADTEIKAPSGENFVSYLRFSISCGVKPFCPFPCFVFIYFDFVDLTWLYFLGFEMCFIVHCLTVMVCVHSKLTICC